MYWKNKNLIISYFITIFITSVVQVKSDATDACYPKGIKLGLGDKWDQSTNYDKEKLSAQKNHDYSISYFLNKDCKTLDSTIIIEYDGKQQELKPFESRFIDKKITVKDVGSKQLQVYIQTFFLNVSDFKIEEETNINYKVNYMSNASVQLQRGPFTFFHHGKQKLLNYQFKLLWIADFDIMPNPKKNNIAFGKDNFDKITQYYEAQKTEIPTIIGGGDYAYDLHTDFGQRGLDFMEYTEKLFSQLPFLPIAGNHESNYPESDFFYFNNYYRTPRFQANNNERYTSLFGRVLVMGFNINYYTYLTSDKYKVPFNFTYYTEFNKEKIVNTIDWMKKTFDELEGQYDWSIVYSHMNMECSDVINAVDCLENGNQLKDFLKLFVERKVDIYIGAHIHNYERFHPHYSSEQQFVETSKCNINNCKVYEDPTAPIQVIDGSGGTQYYFDGVSEPIKNPRRFSAVTDRDAGFSVITLKSKSELKFEHIRSKKMEVIDSFTIKKNYLVKVDLEESELDKGILAGIIVLGILFAISLVFIGVLVKKLRLKREQHVKPIRSEDHSLRGPVTDTQLK